MSTTLQSRDIRLTTEQAENCSKLLLNLMRDGECEIVGAGLRHPFPEMIDAIKAAERERKKDEEKRHKAVMEYLQAELAALQQQLADVESNLGGLPKMGEHLGLNRRPIESEDDFRKRIRDEIQIQILAGTLDDPTGEYRQWAETYDEIEEKNAYLGHERNRFSQAVKGGNVEQAQNSIEDDEILMIPANEIDDVRVLSARNEELDKRDSKNVTIDETIEKTDDVDSFAADFLAAFPPIQENFAAAATDQKPEPQTSYESAPSLPAPNVFG